MNTDMIEIICILVFFLGFYGLITTRNVIKSIVFLWIMEMAVIMFFLSIGYTIGILAPIGTDLVPGQVADPLPQALMITTIVIGLAVTAVNITMLITLLRKHKSANWDVLRQKSSESES